MTVTTANVDKLISLAIAQNLAYKKLDQVQEMIKVIEGEVQKSNEAFDKALRESIGDDEFIGKNYIYSCPGEWDSVNISVKVLDKSLLGFAQYTQFMSVIDVKNFIAYYDSNADLEHEFFADENGQHARFMVVGSFGEFHQEADFKDPRKNLYEFYIIKM